MNGSSWGMFLLMIVAVGIFIGNIVAISKAVGTADTWETIQSPVSKYTTYGILMTCILVAAAASSAYMVGQDVAWILSLVLAVFAFGLSFGAAAMSSIS